MSRREANSFLTVAVASAAYSKLDNTPDQEIIEELKRKRRRARWNAFLTPFITMGSVVLSIGLLMFFMRACQERFPQSPLLKPPAQSGPAH